MMTGFEEKMSEWLLEQIADEKNKRRKEILKKGLSHATLEFLRNIWFPVVGHFDHLYAEWEVIDYGRRFRYLDLAFMPGKARGCIEIHGYGPHARDIEAWRFKDLCKKQAYLGLDGWLFIPIAYLSIVDEPEVIKQLVLSFIGKFISIRSEDMLSWVEIEALRYARGISRSFSSIELAAHLNRSDRQARRILNKLKNEELIDVENDQQRYRMYFAVRNVR